MIHDIPETRVHIVGSKCRVYPNAHQKKRMDSIFGKTRFVRNELISMNRSQEKPYKPITYGLLFPQVDDLIRKNPSLAKEDRNIFRMIAIKLIAATKTIREKGIDLPHVLERGKGRDRFTLRNVAEKKINPQFDKNKVWFPNLGWLSVHFSRPFNADIIQADFSRDSTGCYYVSFLLKEEYRLIPRPQKTVGIDLGTRNIAITSDGLMIPSPNPMSRYEGKMRAEKKRISKMIPGSKNYRKSCRQLARVYRHCQNIREDTIHKATIRLIRNNGFIGKESLNLEEMEKTKKAFRRKLLDVNISSFMEKLLYKADWHNRVVVSVSPYFPSSQLCCDCNTVYPEAKNPSITSWECPKCHSHHQRDVNAAKNIQKEALRLYHHYHGHVPKNPGYSGSGSPPLASA